MSWVQDLVTACIGHASAWRLQKSGSATVTGGLGDFAFVGGTGGTMYLGTGGSELGFAFPYGGVAAGGGLALSFLGPVAGSYTASEFISTGGEFGRLYIPYGLINESDVNLDSIPGPCAMISIEVGWAAAGYFSIILFGGTIRNPAIGPADLYLTTKAVAFQAGGTVTTSIGVTATGYQLYIMQPTSRHPGKH